jgi:nitrilase
MGEILAGPLEGKAGILTAGIDLAEIRRGKFDFDVTGHYMRPDVFRLAVNTAPQPAVTWAAQPGDGAKDEPA